MMNSFDFQAKTEIYFGKGREEELGKILKKHNAKNILIVIGKKSVIKSGLLGRVTHSLEGENITYHILQGVRANPTFDLVREGNKMVIENQIDFILAVGGGSVIDTAKCIAATTYYSGDIKDFNLHKASPTSALPVGVILTIAAAGSEMSASCVIQDDETEIKLGFLSDLIRPVFAIENPELTYSVNKEQTAYGVVDILMHTLERYFSYSDKNELADEFALGLLKNVVEVGLIAYNEPENYDARARIMLDSTISHNGYTSIGKKYVFPVHALEHAVSGRFANIAHGCGLAILFPGWAERYYIYDVDKFARLGRHVFGIKETKKKEAALKCIKAFKSYFKKLGMPSRLSEVGVKESDIDALADIVSGKGSKVVGHHCHPLDRETAKEIYLKVL